MLNFQKNNYKLYNLLEELTLDDLGDDTEELSDIGTINKSRIKSFDQFDIFLQNRILSNDDEGPITPLEQSIINAVNKDIDGTYDGRLVVTDTNQLIVILEKSIKYFGWTGNYNWINTSKITSMLKLFKNAFGKDVAKFNGDISRWDVSNVRTMLYMFDGCKSLTCNISGWDTSNVKYWSKGSYTDTNSIFANICKKLKFPKNAIRSL